MRTVSALGVAFGFAALLGVGAARAQDMGEELDDWSPDRTFAFMDFAPKDGKVTLAEVKGRAAEMDRELEAAGADDVELEKVFDKYAHGLDLFTFLAADANDDLELTLEELASALEREELKLSDKDYGVWAEEECAARWPQMLADYDANKDGIIERTELGQDMAEHGADFDAADADRDGKVTREEMVAYIKRSLVESAKELEPEGDAPPPADPPAASPPAADPPAAPPAAPPSAPAPPAPPAPPPGG